MTKRWASVSRGVALALGLGCLSLLAGFSAEAPPRNVILLISDGCSSEALTLARWYKGKPLALDAIRTGAVKSFIADSVIADSAPTASAYATGVRTSDNFISIGPDRTTLTSWPAPSEEARMAPRATLLEGARLLGKATGVVVTARVSHATPAAFLSHVSQRDREEEIMEQAVYQGVDVVLGGGFDWLVPAAEKGRRKDQEDLRPVLAARGYQLARTAQELQAAPGPRLFGLFAASHLLPEIDRPEVGPEQPALEAMTQRALTLLAPRPQGFFLLVEGSQIDWGAHANDPAYLIHEVLMFDRAVAAALDFARRDGNTLVVALSDHNTGGITIGNRRSDPDYSQTTEERLLAPLRKMRHSSTAIFRRLGPAPTVEQLQALVEQDWSIRPTDEEARLILERAQALGGDGSGALGEVLCPAHTVVGWTTHGHTGGDVPLFSIGPGRLSGLLDGPEVGRKMAEALGLDLDQLTARLFVDPMTALPAGEVRIDKNDPANLVVEIRHRGLTARLPVNKNLLLIDGKEQALPGVVIYIPETGRAFIPEAALRRVDPAPQSK